jgi:predicted GIY-YIG superfamily endonuclease
MSRIGVYILQGTRFYVGSTTNLDARLLQHAAGHTHTTKRIGKWKLFKFIECGNIHDAQELERRIKKSKNIARWLEQPRTH